MVSTAFLVVSVASLALIVATGTALAQSTGQTGGTGVNAPNYNTPGAGGSGGVSGNDLVTGGAGASGVTWVQFTYTGGAGGGSDSGGSGGGGYVLGAGGGGGGGGGAGLAISASGSITSNVLGGTGGAGGNGSGETQGGYRVGGGGGGGGGGSGILVNNANADVTITIGSGVSVKGGLGGEGGDANTSWSYGVNALDNGAGGNGGNGVTANSSTNTTIINSGVIQGGNGGQGGKFVMSDPSVHGAYGQGGYGILGSNMTIVNNAGATISGGTGTGYGARQAIYVIGGTNKLRNDGSINGKIELAGGTTDVFGTYSNVLQVNGGATATITAGDATGFSTISNAGVINVGDGNMLSSGTISNAGAATINLGIGAVLFGSGNTLNNDATINVGTDGVVMDNGDINNNASGTINFNGPGGTALLSPGTGHSVNNGGQIKVLGGDVDVQMSNINNQGNGSVSLTGGDMFGVSAFTNSDTATLNVSAGRKLSVQILNFNGGTIAGTGTIEATSAINLWGNGTVGATLVGSAGLTRGGPGTTVLTGNHTYTGGTTVNAGVLQLGTAGVAGSIRGQITVNGAGTLTVASANTAGITGITNAGTTNFQNATSAGSATITNSGELYFFDTSSAGSTVVTNDNFLEFHDASSAGSGTLTNNGTLLFYDNSLAGTATIANTSSALLNFQTSSSADNARITNDGTLSFYDTSTAGSADITNNRDLTFYDASGAGSAKITNNASLVFLHNGDAGSAEIINGSVGIVDFSGSTGSAGNKKLTAGSIAGAGSYLLGANELTVGSNNLSTAVSGTIGGIGGSLVKTGSGTLTLTGTNTYTGSTTVSGGTLKGGAVNAFSTGSAFTVDGTLELGGFNQEIGSLSGSGTVINSGPRDSTLMVGGDNTSTVFSGTIKDDSFLGGRLALDKVGTGTLTLSGTNTHTGGTTINAGMLQLGTTGAGAATGKIIGAVTVGASGFFNVVNAETSGIASISNEGITFFDGTSSSGSAAIMNDGTALFLSTSTAGVATITNNDTLAFNTSSTAGGAEIDNNDTLNFNDSSKAGSATVNNRGTVNFDDSSTADNAAIINEGGVGHFLYFRGASSAGSAHITNSAGMEFYGTSTAGGADITNEASLNFNEGSSAGSAVITNNGDLSFNERVAIGAISTAASAIITTNNGGTVKFYGNADGGSARFITNAGATFDISNAATGTTTGSIEGAGTYYLGSKTLTVGGNTLSTAVSGTINDGGEGGGTGGSLIKVGAGTLTLSGASTYSGGTRVDGGVLSVSADNNLGVTAGGLTFGGGALQLVAGFDLASSRSINLNAGGGTFDTNGFSTTVSQAISGAGALTKVGAGTLTFSGDSTYTGATTVGGGKLLVNGSISSSSGVTVGASATIGGTGTLSDTLVNGTLSAGNSPGKLTIAGDLTLGAGSTSLFELGAPGTVGSPANDFVYVTGDLTLGGTLQTAGPALSGYYRLFDVDGDIFGSYTTVPTNATVQTAIPHQVNLFIQNGDQLVQFWDGPDGTGNGSVDGGAGTWSAAGTNWTGAPGSASFNDQWHSEVGVFAGIAGTVTVSGPAAFEGLQFKTTGYTIAGGDLTLSGDSAGHATASFVTVDEGVTAVIASALTGSGIGLDKHGSGTLILVGANTYTGDTTIDGGTLQIGNGAGTGSLDGNVVDNAALVFNRSDTYTYAGDISGTGAVQLAGTGTIVLTGALGHTGGTTISGGTLQLGAGGSIVGDIVNNGTLAFNRSGTYAFGGEIEGAGTVQQIGTGTLTLSGSNTYTGPTVVSGGRLAGGAANALSSASAFTVDATLDLGGFNQTIGSLSGTGTVTNSGTADAILTAGDTSATTFSGTIKDGSTSTTALAKTGTGMLTLTGSSTYTGGTTIGHGTLQLGNGGTAGAIVGEVTVGADGIFRVANADTTRISISNDGYTNFVNSTTAGSADITNNGVLTFDNSSSAGGAIITNNNEFYFESGSTAGGATIDNNDLVIFYGNSKAEDANITNDSQLVFRNDSAAGSATIVNRYIMAFEDNSSAASATIITEAGGITLFGNSSSGGDARFITNASGKFDISSFASAGTVAGSIEGAGSYFLGSKQLTVGGNDLDTMVSGVISDCGSSGHDCWAGSGTGGSLVKTGAGTLTLTGANTYTGGTTISDGTLELGGTAGSILGDVLNNAALAFNRSHAYQFDGVISGAGDVEQRGGTTILTGTSTYTGATKVSGGTLLVNGSIASSSAVTVDAGATIGGSGTLSDTLVNGTLSAGNSPGTLTVDGDLMLAATSTSLFQLTAPGVPGGSSNDLVHVTGNLVLGGTLETPDAVSGYYRLFNVDGMTSGAFAAAPAGASVLTNVPNQVNLLLENSGQLVQFWDGADQTGNGSVDGGDGTWSTADTNWTGAPGSAINDQWHSEVGVFAGTAGTVTVSGPVAFEGIQFSTDGYTIAGGELTMTGDSAGNTSASFVNVDGGVTAEIASTLTGAAGIGLDKLGGGTLTLSGINAYTGATTIAGGTLALSANGSIAHSGVVTIIGGSFDISGTTLPSSSIESLAGTSSGTVELGSKRLVITDGATEFAGAIEGGGGLEIAGGTQTLSGVNTYTNATQIDAGATLALKGNGSIASSAYVGFALGGTLDISQTADGASVAGLFSMTGAGTVALGSKTLIITSGSLFGGSIRDGGIGGGAGGSLVIASGAMQEFSGVNMFTGTTTIDAGGTLRLTGDGSLFASSAVVANGVFDISGQNTGSGPGIKSLSGSGEVYLGDRDLGIVSADGTFDGVISDCGATGTECLAGSTGGSLVLSGGTLRLSGYNTYTGGTVVGYFSAPGSTTLVVANNDAVGTGRVLLNAAGIFKAGADGLTFANNFAVSSSFGTVDTNDYTMTIAGVIADAADPGTLHKIGAGTLILTGANSYGDGTVVEAGTLRLGNGGTSGSILGDVAVAGTLAFARSDTYAFAGVVSDAAGGHGRVVQDGSGVLVLTGSNTYSGGTLFNHGVIAVASDDNLGDAAGGLIFDGGTLRFDTALNIAATRAVTLDAGGGVFDTNGFDAAVASNISGSGRLTKIGTGELTLTGDNSYTGPTTVSQGTLGAGSAGAFSPNSAMALAGGASLELGGLDQTIGALSGEGSILLGAGGLTVDQDGDTKFAGAISGAGSLSKEGAGKLLLSGTSTYTGQTFVKAGILSVNGDISSSSLLTVDAGGRLGGNGLLPSVIVNHDGRLSPGNSIGTISIAGNLTFGAGSTYAVETSTTAADRTNVSGTADLSGGTVVVTYAPGTYVAKSYAILNAAGGLGGTEFRDLDANILPGLETSLTYDSNNVYLTTSVKPTDPGCTRDCDPDFGDLNRNQRRVAKAIVSYFDAHDSIPAEFATLDANGLTLASGEVAAGAITAGIESTDQFLGLIGDQALAGSGGAFGSAATSPAAYAEEDKAGDKQFAALGVEASHAADPVAKVFESRWQSWGAAHGGALAVGGDAATGSHDTDADTFGLVGGISRRWGGTLLGLGLGGGSSDFSLSDGLGDGHAGTFNAGIFARQELGEAYVAGAAAYGFHDVETSRAVFGDTLSGDFTAHSFAGRVEAGYGIAMPLATITPYAAFQAIAYRLPSYAETGTGSFALAYDSGTTTATRSELGGRLDGKLFLSDGAVLSLSGRAALAINGGDDIAYSAGFRTLPGTGFVIEGANPDRYSALVDAGAEYKAPSGFFAALAFQGEFSGNVQSLSGKAKIGISW